MDGDSGDEGNDEMRCVTSDESDKSSRSLPCRGQQAAAPGDLPRRSFRIQIHR